MADINSTLTPKQQKYLALLQLAEAEGLSITHVAKEHNIDPSLLYATRKTLRQKGILPQVASTGKFKAIPISQAPQANIELKTQLANGQPIWLSVPPSQLGSTLKALSA